VDRPRGPARRRGGVPGIAEAREYYDRWAAAWAEWDWEIEEVREHRDRVITRTWLTGRGRGSGLVLDMRIAQIWTFRDGKSHPVLGVSELGERAGRSTGRAVDCARSSSGWLAAGGPRRACGLPRRLIRISSPAAARSM
jgi:SnoaL-like domain